MGLFEVVHHDVKTVFFTAYIRIDFDGNRVDLAEFKIHQAYQYVY